MDSADGSAGSGADAASRGVEGGQGSGRADLLLPRGDEGDEVDSADGSEGKPARLQYRLRVLTTASRHRRLRLRQHLRQRLQRPPTATEARARRKRRTSPQPSARGPTRGLTPPNDVDESVFGLPLDTCRPPTRTKTHETTRGARARPGRAIGVQIVSGRIGDRRNTQPEVVGSGRPTHVVVFIYVAYSIQVRC